jgi:hypothetical protein
MEELVLSRKISDDWWKSRNKWWIIGGFNHQEFPDWWF